MPPSGGINLTQPVYGRFSGNYALGSYVQFSSVYLPAYGAISTHALNWQEPEKPRSPDWRDAIWGKDPEK